MTSIHTRTYQGIVDLPAMIALANAYPQHNLHTVDLPYRFSSWALDRLENVCLWEDESGCLLAWASLQPPFWAIDFAIHPDYNRVLLEQILVWADEQAQSLVNTPYGRPAWFIAVFADAFERIQAVEAAGFTSQANVGEDSWTKVLLSRPAGLAISHPPFPEGFTLRLLQGRNEVKLYAYLHRAVFGSTNMTSDWRLRTLLQPAYRADLDLVVAAPDGRLAAFCIGWLDQESAAGITGQIEPLGVAEEYRELGLGKALLAECVSRLEQLGAQRILVETDNYRGAALGLYESTGFTVTRDVLVFRKNYSD
jgi:mycothiol synthase